MINLCYVDLLEIISTTQFNQNKLKAVVGEIIDCLSLEGKPKEFAQSTSYTDYDAIRGSKEEFHADVYQRLSDELQMLRMIIETHENILDMYKVAKEEIEETYSKLSGLECKVFYLRKIQGKPIKDIANELGYTYNYITDIITQIRDLSVNADKIT